MRVRAKTAKDQPWVEAFLADRWGSAVLLRGRLLDAATLPALIAGDREGLATYRLAGGAAEIVTLDAAKPWHGAGTALIAGVARRARQAGLRRLRVTTTNDNLDALRFYQRRGFRIVAVHPGAVTRGRRLKPSIPERGAYGIPIRDEIELQIDIR
jgi:GNAT superfamily N-acetyltransferase